MDAEPTALVDKFYQAALEPGMWSAALADLADALHAEQARMVTIDHSTSTAPFVMQTGMGDAELERCLSKEAIRLLEPLVNPYLANLGAGTAMIQGKVTTDAGFERSGYYNEIIRPMKMFYGTSVSNRVTHLPLEITICRARSHNEFQQHELRAMEQIFPHIQRAQRRLQRLQVSDDNAARLTAMIERLPGAAIVLDAANRPILVNAPAERILHQGNGLARVAGELQAATPVLTEQLRKAIGLANVSPADHGQWLHLPRRGHRLPLLLEIVPIWRFGLAEPGLRAPRVAIFIREPDAPLQIDRVALIETFGLTRRECEIVCLLAEGVGVNAIAARLGIRPGTVRHNLKSSFEKTDTHSQAAMVALVCGFGY